MFASVLHLDYRAIHALRITDAYSLHRAVYSLYSDERSEEEKKGSKPSGFLYAEQRGGDQNGKKILLLSNRAPRDTVDGKHGQVLTKPIPLSYFDHPRYRFSIAVNPTRRSGKLKTLYPIKEHEAIKDWFINKTARDNGIEINQDNSWVDRVDVLQFKKDTHSITVMQAHLEGTLTVTNKEAFMESVTKGIGRGRAYGCGLLQVTPLIDDLFL